MRKTIIITCVITILALCLLGCGKKGEITSLIKDLPEVSAFLKDHPGAQINAVSWRKAVVARNIDQIRVDCGEYIEIAKYWKVTIKEGNIDMTVWIDDESKETFCIIKQGDKADPKPNEKKEIENLKEKEKPKEEEKKDTGEEEEKTAEPTPVMSLAEYCYFLVHIEIPKNGVGYDENNKEIYVKIKNIGDVDLSGFRLELSGKVGYDVDEIKVNDEIIDNLGKWPPKDAESWDECYLKYSKFGNIDVFNFDNQLVKIGETFEARIVAGLPDFQNVAVQVEPRVNYYDIVTSCETKSVSYGLKRDIPYSKECENENALVTADDDDDNSRS